LGPDALKWLYLGAAQVNYLFSNDLSMKKILAENEPYVRIGQKWVKGQENEGAFRASFAPPILGRTPPIPIAADKMFEILVEA